MEEVLVEKLGLDLSVKCGKDISFKLKKEKEPEIRKKFLMYCEDLPTKVSIPVSTVHMMGYGEEYEDLKKLLLGYIEINLKKTCI